MEIDELKKAIDEGKFILKFLLKSVEVWYFVTIIVLTYCEKKLFQCEEKKVNREKSLQIRGRKAKNL